MKKLIPVMWVILLCYSGLAQELKKVTKDSLNYTQKFNVLAANPAIRSGEYQLQVRSSGKILTQGRYLNGKKDGLWYEYDDQDHVFVEGRYTAGKKTGEWKYFNDLWVLANKYDFTARKLVYHLPVPEDTTGIYQIIRGRGDTVTASLDRAPIYLGGRTLMFRPIEYNITAPEAARKAHVAGRVRVSFTLNTEGHTSDYRVDQGIGYGCDEEALKLVKQIPDNWLPGILNGKNVSVRLELPVVFNFRK